MKNNVETGRLRPCTGCFACSIVCPTNAITMIQDDCGFYHPFINSELCVKCEKCVELCYSHKTSFSNTDTIQAYYGWHKNSEIRKNSSSGGITYAIASSLIKKGFTIIGCSYDNKSRTAKHIIIFRHEDLYKLQGSKYFQSDLTECVNYIKETTKKDEKKIVFFGTPCQILGVKESFIMKGLSQSNIYFVELFCHGIVSPLVWQYYLDSQKFNGIIDVKFRIKHFSWHIPCNEFILDNGSHEYTKRDGDSFFRIFYSKQMFNEACYDCKARMNMGVSDLRIGDYWGSRFNSNKEGVSCVLSFNSRGENILDLCKDDFFLFDADLAEILSNQSYNECYFFNKDKWNNLYTMLKRNGIQSVVKYINEEEYNLKERIKIKIKNIIKNIIYR